MDTVISIFKSGYLHQNGYAISEAITPVAPSEDAGRLYAFYRSSNAVNVQNDLRNALVYRNDLHLNKAEANAWLEVFSAYWVAVGELLAAEEQ